MSFKIELAIGIASTKVRIPYEMVKEDNTPVVDYMYFINYVRKNKETLNDELTNGSKLTKNEKKALRIGISLLADLENRLQSEAIGSKQLIDSLKSGTGRGQVEVGWRKPGNKLRKPTGEVARLRVVNMDKFNERREEANRINKNIREAFEARTANVEQE